jgi:hypothetical protein
MPTRARTPRRDADAAFLTTSAQIAERTDFEPRYVGSDCGQRRTIARDFSPVSGHLRFDE